MHQPPEWPNIIQKTGKENPISLTYHSYPPNSQINLQEDPYQLQNKNDIITRTNMTNPDDHFKESLLTLLNGQQDLQKQSFNLMRDMTHRHEYDN